MVNKQRWDVTLFIYKITNTVNGKLYIGQSKRSIEKRFKRHLSDANNGVLNTHFARAIRKYGSDNFTIELIDTANSQAELNEKERYWIQYYNTVNNGYNETDALYKSGGNTYQSKTDDDMVIISEKLRASKTGSLNPNAKAVKCMNIKDDIELHFSTVEECRQFFNEDTHRFITTRVTGKTFSLYRDEWAISYENNDYHYERKHKTGNVVLVEHITTGETTKYYSKREASSSLHIDRARLKDGVIINDEYKITILN